MDEVRAESGEVGGAYILKEYEWHGKKLGLYCGSYSGFLSKVMWSPMLSCDSATLCLHIERFL